MQILKNQTNFDFIGKRKIALFISTVLNLAILIGIVTVGFNLGVDFAGGTVVELKFTRPIDAAEVRRRATENGLPDVTIQRIGGADENTFFLRMGGVTQLTKESAGHVEGALRGLGTELKQVYSDLENGLVNFRTATKVEPGAVKEAIEKTGTGVKEVRALGEAQGGGFDYQVVASGMAERVFQAMSKGLEQPDFIQQRVDYVGPQVGKQLRNKGVMALVYAMISILVYVAFRFDFKFGPGAVVAGIHDVVMVSGYYLLSQREFNLTAIAALLTIIGYSINDTIVIYDRIREEMGRFKGKPFAEIINIAINETLGRTILTASVTALSLIGLLIFGVGEIWDFAMAMLVGLLVGTYSTIYIASPMTIWIEEWTQAKSSARMKAKVA